MSQSNLYTTHTHTHNIKFYAHMHAWHTLIDTHTHTKSYTPYAARVNKLLTVGTTVTKNCEPFVFGPALAMLTV